MLPLSFFRRFLLGWVALPLMASAQNMPPMPPDAPTAPAHRGPPPGMSMAGLPMLPELRGLRLSEAQQDKVFQIMHAQALAFYEAMKVVQRADTDLHKASLAPSVDVARLRSFADAVGKAQAEIALLHASTSAKVFALLTPEQLRQQTEEGSRPPPVLRP